MTTHIQAIRGMNDILPNETSLWQHIEKILKEALHGYGYQEIRFPSVEKTELFKRSIGEETDIVEKEMYTFVDRNGDSLTLRPEGTACCVRAGIEHGLLYNQIQRLWYLGPFYRHERPQKGRYRQFHQLGAEVFGLAGPDIDADLISLSAKILERLGLKNYVTLELNTLGSPAARQLYRKVLVDYLEAHKEQLDEDSKKRLLTNPLRILDSKNPDIQTLVHEAPKLSDHLDDESKTHFTKLCEFLDNLEIKYKINSCLVRGLDYYTKTVFEWTTSELGAQGTVCAGGRYDGLVEQLGGSPTPALGFAIGLERLILLVQQIQQKPQTNQLDIYLVSSNEESFKAGMEYANKLRDVGYNVLTHCGGGNFKNQLKKADKSGAQYAIILGENELKSGMLILKSLRVNEPEQTLSLEAVLEKLQKLIYKPIENFKSRTKAFSPFEQTANWEKDGLKTIGEDKGWKK